MMPPQSNTMDLSLLAWILFEVFPSTITVMTLPREKSIAKT